MYREERGGGYQSDAESDRASHRQDRSSISNGIIFHLMEGPDDALAVAQKDDRTVQRPELFDSGKSAFLGP